MGQLNGFASNELTLSCQNDIRLAANIAPDTPSGGVSGAMRSVDCVHRQGGNYTPRTGWTHHRLAKQ